MSYIGFDARKVKPRSGFKAIPQEECKDFFKMCIIESEMKDVKPKKKGEKSPGEYLELKLEILEGEYKGRKVWDRLNLKNQNPDTVEMAEGTMSAICYAVHYMTPKDSSELHGKIFLAKLKFIADEGFGEKNEPFEYTPLKKKKKATEDDEEEDEYLKKSKPKGKKAKKAKALAEAEAAEAEEEAEAKAKRKKAKAKAKAAAEAEEEEDEEDEEEDDADDEDGEEDEDSDEDEDDDEDGDEPDWDKEEDDD